MIEMSSQFGLPIEGSNHLGLHLVPQGAVRRDKATIVKPEPPYDWATQESARTLDEVLAAPIIGDSIDENPDDPIGSMQLNDDFTRIKRDYEERAGNAHALSLAMASLRRRPALPPLDKDRFLHPDFGINTTIDTRMVAAVRVVVQAYNAMPDFVEGIIDEAVAIRNENPSGARRFR